MSYIKDLVSVVIPTYNYSKYITETIDSLKYQTYKFIEIIIIDDCSVDNTEEILREYIFNNKEYFHDIVYMKLPRNSDEWWALNIGFFMCKGEYIVIHGSDDISEKTKIDKQVKYLQKNKSVSCVATGYYSCDEDIKNCINGSFWLSFNRQEIKYNYIAARVKHCICYGTLMIRRFVIEKIIGTKKLVPVINDMYFVRDIVRNGFVVDNIKQNLYYIRTHKRQKSKSIDDKDYIHQSMKYIEDRVSAVIIINDMAKSIKALKSILNQSYKNIEIIVINESNKEIYDEIIKLNHKDTCLCYLKTKRKIGFPLALNVGAYLARGEFIAFNDSENINDKYRYEKQVKDIQENKFDLVTTENKKSTVKNIANIYHIMMLTNIINTTAGISSYYKGKEITKFLENVEKNYNVKK
ncbi:glycosyltransferase family 2 protein [Clostridiaceae bacterium M8S5]|nr:glycosyltransferase family 2 protein [Clostridiaceae bacterium M8S5]